jgi:hypothetical protein
VTPFLQGWTGTRQTISLLGALSIVSSLLLVGCVGQTANVRALRQYENEHVTPELINEHLDQLHGTLKLIDRVVNQTPYQPGDAWVKVLPLNAVSAARTAEALARNPSAEIKPTLLKVYGAHVN